MSSLKDMQISSLYSIDKLPTPSNIYATKGINKSSNHNQPDGIIDWFGYNIQSNIPNRHIEVDVRIFSNDNAAINFINNEITSYWYKPSIHKFKSGKFENGISYCQSYISQHGNSYSSFVFIRHSRILIIIDVYEIKTKNPHGITESELKYVKYLLSKTNDA
jgi:hypothetical protein